ncbi:MAG: single-stranded DNA-binding protein [Bacteroidales bacterium]|jgi:single-strand DNA-binding protein|nr:single-stranded DNA-binding protein [Bacteroidales bacterium]
MSGVNKAILIGYMGKDPESRVFENGRKKVSFTLATTEVYKDKDGNRKEVTEWHNIACWRALADIAEKYFTKGKLLYVEGRLRNRTWEENGQKKYFTEIEADNITMLGSKSGDKATEQKVEQVVPVNFPEDSGEDIPF